jgi:heterodisulfide reductase subunit C
MSGTASSSAACSACCACLTICAAGFQPTAILSVLSNPLRYRISLGDLDLVNTFALLLLPT